MLLLEPYYTNSGDSPLEDRNVAVELEDKRYEIKVIVNYDALTKKYEYK